MSFGKIIYSAVVFLLGCFGASAYFYYSPPVKKMVHLVSFADGKPHPFGWFFKNEKKWETKVAPIINRSTGELSFYLSGNRSLRWEKGSPYLEGKCFEGEKPMCTFIPNLVEDSAGYKRYTIEAFGTQECTLEFYEPLQRTSDAR